LKFPSKSRERERGERLQALGFAVYAPDLFGEVFSDGERGTAVISALARDAPELRRRLLASWQVLAARVASTYAVGHCFGGLAALELARAGAGYARSWRCTAGSAQPRQRSAVRCGRGCSRVAALSTPFARATSARRWKKS
jgi:dienelactone hydrolase